MRSLRAIRALVMRDLLIGASYKLPFILDLLFGFISLVIFFFIARTFVEASSVDLGAASNYFEFAAAGVVITAVTETASVGLARRLRDEQLAGTLEALSVQPVTPGPLALGIAGFPFLFALIRVPLYLGLAAGFLNLDLSRADWVGVLLTLVLTGTSLAVLGISLGAAIMIFKRGESLGAFMSFGLSLLGGALFPVTVLPAWLEIPSRVVPTRYVFEAVRLSLYEGALWSSQATALLLFSLAGLPAAVWVFARALAHVKKAGTLSQY